MSDYPKAFETWYMNHTRVQCLRDFQMWEYKRVLYNAWKMGRAHQKRTDKLHQDNEALRESINAGITLINAKCINSAVTALSNAVEKKTCGTR